MDRRSNRRRLHSRPDNGIYDRLILSGMDIPESVDTQKKAQENHSKMAETPVPSLILSLSVSTIFTMLIATSYNIVDTYFVSDLGESSVAAVGIMFSVMALIQAVGYTWGMGAGSEIARLLGKQKKREAEQTLATALAGGILSGAVMAVQGGCGKTSGGHGHKSCSCWAVWNIYHARGSGHVRCLCSEQCPAG